MGYIFRSPLKLAFEDYFVIDQSFQSVSFSMLVFMEAGILGSILLMVMLVGFLSTGFDELKRFGTLTPCEAV